MIKLASDTVDRADINALIEWLQQDPIPKLTKGEFTWQLEQKWADKIGTKYAVYVNSGSSAILLALAALLEFKYLRNNKIVVPTLSWATDVSSPMILGMTPILCDCNLEDLSCDLQQLEELFIAHEPASFISVSPLGLVPKMDELMALCAKYDVLFLEDNCESIGSKYRGKYLGSLGFASFFSMFFGHHLSTIEGGFINTNDERFYHALLMMRSHGWDRDLPEWRQAELRAQSKTTDFTALYNFYVPGINVRATDLQAFIGIRAIDKMDDYSTKRNRNFLQYLQSVKTNRLQMRVDSEDFISNFALPVVNDRRDEIVIEMKANNVEIRPLIAGNIGNKPFWIEKYGRPTNMHNAELIDRAGFYLPNHQDLKPEDIKLVSDILNKYEYSAIPHLAATL